MVESVAVEEQAVIDLAQYLAEIERIGKRSVRDVGMAVQSGVNLCWGTGKVKQFQDKNGAMWIADISDRFDGEVLFALIRSGEGGKRRVVKVVGEDELLGMLPKQRIQPSNNKHLDEMPTMEEQGLDSKNPSGPSLAEQRDRLIRNLKNCREDNETLKRILAEQDNGPALVRWINTGQGCEEVIESGDVSEKIQELIAEGIKSETIVVWTRRKQAKIKVELE